MWLNTDRPGQPVQAKDAKLKIAGVPDDTSLPAGMERHPAAEARWQQPLDAPGRVPAHRIYHEANGYLTGLIPNDEWRVRKRQNYYFNAIRDVDQQIVQILDQLDRLGLTDKTIVIFTSDHGELLGSHGGLSGKGTTAYRQQNHVPMLIVHPDIKGGQRCRETTSHLDLVPTIVAMTGKSTAPVADTMARMKGKDLTPLLSQPVNPAFSRGARWRAVLLQPAHGARPEASRSFSTRHCTTSRSPRQTSSGPSKHFPSTGRCGLPSAASPTSATSSRRYFSFRGSTRRRTLDELRAKNDLELYDLRADPDEVVNLAYDFDANRDLIAAMNAKLNALIANEIGVDDGSFLPLKDWIDWDKAGPASINL